MLKNVCLITIIQNGNQFFKIWYKYYSSFIPEKNIFVIDYNSTDGSLANLNCNIIAKPDFSVEKLHQGNALINSIKSDLLKMYEYVIYADYDEIIFYPEGLEKLLTLKERYYTTYGYEIVQKRDTEVAINFSEPLISQRNYWYRCATYDKPLITSIDFNWAVGNHSAVLKRPIIKNGIEDGFDNVVMPANHVPGLYLLHLHKVDFDYCLNLNKRNILEKGEAKNGGAHNFIVGAEFDQWWKDAEFQLTLIPSFIKDNLCI